MLCRKLQSLSEAVSGACQCSGCASAAIQPGQAACEPCSYGAREQQRQLQRRQCAPSEKRHREQRRAWLAMAGPATVRAAQPSRATPVAPIRKICQECWHLQHASMADLPCVLLHHLCMYVSSVIPQLCRLHDMLTPTTLLQRDARCATLAASGSRSRLRRLTGKVRSGPKSGARAHAATAAARAQGVPVLHGQASAASPVLRPEPSAAWTWSASRWRRRPTVHQRSPRKTTVRRAALQSQAAMAARGLPTPLYSTSVGMPRHECVNGAYSTHRPYGSHVSTSPPTPPLSPASGGPPACVCRRQAQTISRALASSSAGRCLGWTTRLQAPGLLSFQQVAELPLLPAPVRVLLRQGQPYGLLDVSAPLTWHKADGTTAMLTGD